MLPILLVEDHHIIQRVTASDLERLGYTIEVAGTADEALQALYAKQFGLILMDIGLPDEKNGFDVSQSIRNDENCPNQQTSIVVVTAHSTDKLSQQRCQDINIQALFVKPLTPDKLQKALGYFSISST